MEAIMASNCGCCHDLLLVHKRRIAAASNLSLSSLACVRKLERHEGGFPGIGRFHVKMQQTESPMKHNENNRDSQPVKLHAKGKPVNVVSHGQPVKLGRIHHPVAEVPPSKESNPKALPSDESFSWANENYNSLQRTIDVWSFILSLRVRVLFDNAKWSYPGGFTKDKQKTRRRKTASWLRDRVLQLGPTFIKLAQLSSTRSDLFPHEIANELAKLHVRLRFSAFSPTKAKGFIERELGAPVNELFKEFEDQPIAAASLGQVLLYKPTKW